MDRLPGFDSLLDSPIRAVRPGQSQRIAAPRRGRQCHYLQPLVLAQRRGFALLLIPDRLDQFLERRLEMRFIVDEQRILPEEPRVQRPGLETEAIPTEE